MKVEFQMLRERGGEMGRIGTWAGDNGLSSTEPMSSRITSRRASSPLYPPEQAQEDRQVGCKGRRPEVLVDIPSPRQELLHFLQHGKGNGGSSQLRCATGNPAHTHQHFR